MQLFPWTIAAIISAEIGAAISVDIAALRSENLFFYFRRAGRRATRHEHVSLFIIAEHSAARSTCAPPKALSALTAHVRPCHTKPRYVPSLQTYAPGTTSQKNNTPSSRTVKKQDSTVPRAATTVASKQKALMMVRTSSSQHVHDDRQHQPGQHPSPPPSPLRARARPPRDHTYQLLVPRLTSPPVGHRRGGREQGRVGDAVNGGERERGRANKRGGVGAGAGARRKAGGSGRRVR